MPTLFPGGIDNFNNPTPANNLNDAIVLHSDEHSNANDAIEALEQWVGVSGSTNPTTIEYRVNHPPMGGGGMGVVVWASGTFVATGTVLNFTGDAVSVSASGTVVQITITGSIGPVGPSGSPGSQGPIGPSGSPGSQGPQGIQGPTGSVGPQGPIGPSGSPGSQGIQGPTGAQGPQGIEGATGATGPQGPAGAGGGFGIYGEAAGTPLGTGTVLNVRGSNALFTISGTTLDLFVTGTNVFYSVKDYGAVGDGTTNDTTAVQNAINAAHAAGGGVVWLPVGTYSCGPLTAYRDSSIWGAGMMVSVLKARTAGTLLNYPYAGNLDPASRFHGFLMNFSLDGNSGTGTTGIAIDTGWDMLLQRVGAFNFSGAGFDFQAVLISTLDRCVSSLNAIGLRNVAARGVESNLVQIDRCRITDNSQWAIYYTGGTQIDIRGSEIETNGTAGNNNTGGVYTVPHQTQGMHFIDCWFEANHGVADIYVGQPDTNNAWMALDFCYFVNSSSPPTYGVFLGTAGGVVSTLIARECRVNGDAVSGTWTASGAGATIELFESEVGTRSQLSGGVVTVITTTFVQGIPGIYGEAAGVPLGTGTILNVRGPNALFTLSGTTLDLFITGAAGSQGPAGPAGAFGVFGENQGTPLGTGTILNFRGSNVVASISGTTIDVFVTGSSTQSCNSTYMLAGIPTALATPTGTNWKVPSSSYASGSLAVFYNGSILVKGTQYEELIYISGTYHLLFTPVTGSTHMVTYGVSCATQTYSTGSAPNVGITDSNGVLIVDSNGVQIVDSNGN